MGLGLAACQRERPVGFITAAALVHELMEAYDELGFVLLSKTGAERLFELLLGK